MPGQYNNRSHIPCKDGEGATDGEFRLGLKVIFIEDRGTVDSIKGTVLQPPPWVNTLFQIPENVKTVLQLPQLPKSDPASGRAVLQLLRRTDTLLHIPKTILSTVKQIGLGQLAKKPP